MSLVTTGVEFSFDDVMYRQVDGVAMGSPLGPVLANIFVGYCESLIDASLWPVLYVRFVDDSFTYFDSTEQCDHFLHDLNSLHPSLKYTCEHEHDNRLSFLDVLVEKSNDDIITSVYRKPTFTGQYIVYDSYCSFPPFSCSETVTLLQPSAVGRAPVPADQLNHTSVGVEPGSDPHYARGGGGGVGDYSLRPTCIL